MKKEDLEKIMFHLIKIRDIATQYLQDNNIDTNNIEDEQDDLDKFYEDNMFTGKSDSIHRK